MLLKFGTHHFPDKLHQFRTKYFFPSFSLFSFGFIVSIAMNAKYKEKKYFRFLLTVSFDIVVVAAELANAGPLFFG